MQMLDLLSPTARAALLNLIDERVSLQLASTPSCGQESPWLTVAEAAVYLRTSQAAIYKRIKRGQLRAHRPDGSRVLLRRADLVPAGPSATEVL